MITKRDVWKTLVDKENSIIAKLCEKKESLFLEKKRLEARIADIDKYVFEYTSGLQQESNVEYGVKKINDRLYIFLLDHKFLYYYDHYIF